MRSLILISLLFITGCISNSYPVNASQADVKAIQKTLFQYIDGTANGDPDLLRDAFHPDFNLYLIEPNGLLKVRNGQKYIDIFEDRKRRDRIGKIVMIDAVNDAATAKVEITMPDRRIFVDYFLLMKIDYEWKIIHKSYTPKM